ncbi:MULTISPECIES: DUF2817 domain-containing protein [unclassified Exiguobacterium]|uniref:DUF2817 domain-containing protein n=2 Tax=Exiguobacterium TaxID=33986 RepID=UPI001BE676C9|nr:MULTISPECIES: DUF2817 domain-containing protein [unclassified Exiguobacterium]
MLQYFSGTCETARKRLLETALHHLPTKYPSISHLPINQAQNASCDLIHAKREGNHALLILSSGLHGIEGFTGSAMQLRFLEEHLARLNSSEVDLLFIHAMNVDTMDHHTYAPFRGVFIPKAGSGSRFGHFPFSFQTVSRLLPIGPGRLFKSATTVPVPQPISIHFDGQPPDPYIHDVLSAVSYLITPYSHVLFLDCHTGHGLQTEVQLVLPSADCRTPDHLKEFTRYPIVEHPLYLFEGEWLNSLYQWTHEKQIGFLGLIIECGTAKDSSGFRLPLQAIFTENRLWRQHVMNETDLLFSHMVELMNDPLNYPLLKRNLTWSSS